MLLGSWLYYIFNQDIAYVKHIINLFIGTPHTAHYILFLSFFENIVGKIPSFH